MTESLTEYEYRLARGNRCCVQVRRTQANGQPNRRRWRFYMMCADEVQALWVLSMLRYSQAQGEPATEPVKE